MAGDLVSIFVRNLNVRGLVAFGHARPFFDSDVFAIFNQALGIPKKIIAATICAFDALADSDFVDHKKEVRSQESAVSDDLG